MREILFRGKQKDGGSYDGRWIYGDLVRIKERISGGQYEIKTRIFKKNCGYLVDPETVGQYTGLTDKKGKKIFEGDILDCCFSWCKMYGMVAFSREHAGFYLYDKYLKPIGSIEDNKMRIIGNKFDAPKLLEEKC